MNEELWARIPGYPDYAVSDQGRVLNTKLNRIVEGQPHGNDVRVSIKSQDGYFHYYPISRLIMMVDFKDVPEEVETRKIRNVDTGELYTNVEHARRALNASDRSSVYKVLKGTRPSVMGARLEYYYD